MEVANRLQPLLQEAVLLDGDPGAVGLQDRERLSGARQRLVELLLLALLQDAAGEVPEVCLGAVVLLAVAGAPALGDQTEPQQRPKIGAGVALRDADGSDDAVHGHGVLVQVEDGPDPSHGWGDAPELTDAAHAVDEARPGIFSRIGPAAAASGRVGFRVLRTLLWHHSPSLRLVRTIHITLLGGDAWRDARGGRASCPQPGTSCFRRPSRERRCGSRPALPASPPARKYRRVWSRLQNHRSSDSAVARASAEAACSGEE